MTPFFSICIPQYNRTSFLIEACRALQAQRFQDFEVCISDDGSTDGRHDELASFLKASGLAYVFQRQARNQRYDGNLRSSIHLAKGLYCLLMGNDDCLSSPTVLEDLQAALVSIGPHRPAVCLTNYQDFTTGEVFRRVRRSGLITGGPTLAVTEFRNFSFVSGVIFDREPAQRHATDRWDGSEMYQMYLASRLLAAGGDWFGWDHVAVRKDIRLDGEKVDSYAMRPRLDPCPIIERRLPMSQIVRVNVDAVSPYISPAQQEQITQRIAQQLLFFTYPYWIFEYRRIQSWRYALGICLGMRPKNLLEGLCLSSRVRWKLNALHAVVSVIGLLIPVRVFGWLRRPLYSIAKAALSHA